MGCTPTRRPEGLKEGNLVEFVTGSDGLVQAMIEEIEDGWVTAEITYVEVEGGFYEVGKLIRRRLDHAEPAMRPTHGMLGRVPLVESEESRAAREARDAARMRRLGARTRRRHEEAILKAIIGKD